MVHEGISPLLDPAGWPNPTSPSCLSPHAASQQIQDLAGGDDAGKTAFAHTGPGGNLKSLTGELAPQEKGSTGKGTPQQGWPELMPKEG